MANPRIIEFELVSTQTEQPEKTAQEYQKPNKPLVESKPTKMKAQRRLKGTTNPNTPYKAVKPRFTDPAVQAWYEQTLQDKQAAKSPEQNKTKQPEQPQQTATYGDYFEELHRRLDKVENLLK